MDAPFDPAQDKQTTLVSEPVAVTPDPAVITPNEPIPAPETAQAELVSDPTPTPPETPTPQLPADEALPESTPEMETPTPSPIPVPDANEPEEPALTPPQTQQGMVQPEPTPTPASAPESVPAQTPPTATPPRNILMLLLTKARLVTQLRKQKKLLKIMTLFAKKKSITNDDVEKLLHVSDATALRYLAQLKKENKIAQIGKTGQGVIYTKR